MGGQLHSWSPCEFTQSLIVFKLGPKKHDINTWQQGSHYIFKTKFKDFSMTAKEHIY